MNRFILKKLRVIFIICILCILMIATTVLTSFASVSDLAIMESVNPLTAVPENLEYIQGNAGDLYSEYTYTVNGNKYKVIDKASEDWKNVYSEIYLIKNDEDILYATESLHNSGKEIYVTINENGVETTDIINTSAMDDTVSEYNAEVNIDPTIENLTRASGETFDGMSVSNWIFYDEYKDITNIKRYTVALVISVIGAAVGVLSGSAWVSIMSAGITNVAEIIVEEKIPKVYYKCNCYYKTVLPSDPDMFRMKIAEQDYYVYYSDSSRSNKIGTGTTYYYHPDFTNHY